MRKGDGMVLGRTGFGGWWRAGRSGARLIVLVGLVSGLAARLVPAQEVSGATAETVSGGGAEGQQAAEAIAPGVVARSARLTFVAEGVVLVEPEGGGGSQMGQENMALAQGTRVSAGENGQAEIEFEDGSVARLTPNSAIRLDYLGMDPTGKNAVTVLQVAKGLVYVELRAAAAAQFRVIAGEDTFWPMENASVRVSLDDPPAVLSVLDGRIRVEHIARPRSGDEEGPRTIEGYRTDVRAGQSLRSDGADASRYFLADSVPPESWDQWNETRDQAAADELAAATPVREGFAGSQGYGWGDLDAGGSWYNQPGQAAIWQPDEALDAGFDPYGYGSWTYYPGAGYTWASGYRWGWTPYRCGRWEYVPGFGWGWIPDRFCRTGFYGGYAGGVYVVRGPRGYIPKKPPIYHGVGVHPIVPVHHGPPPVLTRSITERREASSRQIAGLVVAPISPNGRSYTMRGGSAVGSALRRDYGFDERSHRALAGVVDDRSTVIARPASAGPSWHAVSTRADTPAASSGGFRSIFGHGGHAPAEAAAVKTDPKGNPYVAPVRTNAAGASGNGVVRVPTGADRAASTQARGGGTSQGGQGNARVQANTQAPAAHAESHASAPAAASAAAAAAPPVAKK